MLETWFEWFKLSSRVSSGFTRQNRWIDTNKLSATETEQREPFANGKLTRNMFPQVKILWSYRLPSCSAFLEYLNVFTGVQIGRRINLHFSRLNEQFRWKSTRCRIRSLRLSWLQKIEIKVFAALKCNNEIKTAGAYKHCDSTRFYPPFTSLFHPLAHLTPAQHTRNVYLCATSVA